MKTKKNRPKKSQKLFLVLMQADKNFLHLPGLSQEPQTDSEGGGGAR